MAKRKRIHRNKIQQERDQSEAAQLYIQGKTQAEIAEIISKRHYGDYRLHPRTIAYDIEAVRKKWLHSSLMSFDEAKAKELAHLDELERAAWKGWQRSLGDKVVTEDNEMDDTLVLAGGATKEITRKWDKERRETTAGDKRFLDMVADCIDKRCKILGLFSPEKYEVDWRQDLQKLGVSESVANQQFENIVKEMEKAIIENEKREAEKAE